VLPKVQEDLQLSNFLAGFLATIFLLGYFATSPIFGHLSDRGTDDGRSFRRKGLIALGIAVWSAATIASGLSRGALSLVAARALVGVGEASYATIAPTIIDDLAPPARRGRWLAIFYVAMPIGSALGYLVGGAVEKQHGWRAAFWVAGLPGLVLALACLLIVEPPRRTRTEEPAELLKSAGLLARVPTFRRAVLGYCAYTFSVGGFAYWAPKFLYAQYAMPLASANFRFGLVTVVAGAIGTIVGGWLGDRMGRARERRFDTSAPASELSTAQRDWAACDANMRICAVSAFLAAPLAAMAVLSARSGPFFGYAFLAEIGIFLSTGPVNVVLLRSVPEHLRASAMALSIFAIHLFGDLWSPPLIGLIADHAAMGVAMLLVPLGFAVALALWWAPVRLPERDGPN
jgi:MFS family permease